MYNTEINIDEERRKKVRHNINNVTNVAKLKSKFIA